VRPELRVEDLRVFVSLLRNAPGRAAPAPPVLFDAGATPAGRGRPDPATPREGSAWCERALQLQRQERTAEAAEAYREALRLEPNRTLAWFGLGLALRRLGRQQEALAAYQQAVRVAPDFAQAWYRLGRLHEQQGEYPEAIHAYREAVRGEPDHAVAWYDLAILCREEGRLADAVEAFLATLRLKPRFTDAWLGLGISYAKQNNRPGILEVYQQLAGLDPATAEAFASQYVETRCEPVAPPPPAPAAPERPTSGSALHPLAETWYEIGVLHRKQGRGAEAISDFLEAVRFDPNHAKAWWNLASLHRAGGNQAEALRALRELIRVKPKLAAAWCDLADLHAHRGQHDKAMKAFRRAVQAKPECAEAWWGLGRCCLALGHALGLAEVLERLRLLNPQLAQQLPGNAETALNASPLAGAPPPAQVPTARPRIPSMAASFGPWLTSLRKGSNDAAQPKRPRARRSSRRRPA
jgi:tetratricopeptide (TPR) repeat protein